MSTLRDMGTGEHRVRYLIVGGFNTLFGFALFAALDLTIAPHVGHYVVLTVATVIAVAVSHATQRRWAWLSSAPYLTELGRFSSVYLVMFLVNLAVLYIAHSVLGAPVIPSQAAIATLLVVGTYLVHRAWTFAEPFP